jgi:hypothetical protein
MLGQANEVASDAQHMHERPSRRPITAHGKACSRVWAVSCWDFIANRDNDDDGAAPGTDIAELTRSHSGTLVHS